MSSKYRKNSTPIEQAKNTEFSPADACRKGKFEEMRPGNSDTKSILGNLGVTPGLPDTKSILEALRVMPEVLDTKSILGNLGVTPGLPDTKSSLEALRVMPEVLDTKSILGNLGVTPGLPDTKSSLEALRVMPEVLDTKSILGNLGVTPGLPDTKSSLEALRVMPEVLDTKSILGNLRVTPELLSVYEFVPEAPGTVVDSIESGDARDMSADTDSRPAAAPPSSCNKVTLRAEFKLHLDLAPTPRPIKGSEPDASSDAQHYVVLRELERRLRSLVGNRLLELVGPKWIKQRVPQAVRERWHKRQDEDRANGRSVYEAIEYADFMDLSEIIVGKNNWKEAFQSIFRDREDIGVSLRRLHPVRKALAHSRPLSQMDILTLITETSRILARLDIRTLH